MLRSLGRQIRTATHLLKHGDLDGFRRGILNQVKGRTPHIPPSPPPRSAPAFDINAEIRRRIKPNSKTIAFFYPDGGFRKSFSSIPARLAEENGFSVINLFGTRLDDELERLDNSLYVGGGLIESVDTVDLFFISTIMDVLPKRGKRALLNHGSFAPFEAEAHEVVNDMSAEDALGLAPEIQHQHDVNYATHFNAFFPLIEYYLMASQQFRNTALQYARTFDLKMFQEGDLGLRQYYEGLKSRVPPDMRRRFEQRLALQNQRLPREIFVVPSGYPQVDSGFRAGQASVSTPKTAITFAPTPIDGKPAWHKYSAIKNSGLEIIGALLENFPEFEICFKPHVSEQNSETRAVIDRFTSHPKFRLDLSGSNHADLYSKTALLVSDFSQTAFTFAASYGRPVLFYSCNEKSMPKSLLEETFCRGREEVGSVATTPRELIEKARGLLANAHLFAKKIERFRQISLFNLGRSEDYICEMVPYMLRNEVHPSWTGFKNTELDQK